MNSDATPDKNTCARCIGTDVGLAAFDSASAAVNDARREISSGDISTLSMIVAADVLTFFCLAHLGVMFCFCIGANVSPFIAPAALLLSLVVGELLARREGLRFMMRIASTAIVLAVMALALLLAAAFFDMSWDGLWYHQTAVYQMSHGWNPLKDPLHNFTPNLQDMLQFYAKGPWYAALAVYQTTSNIEWAKAEQWLALAAAFFMVFAVCIDFGMRRFKALAIAAIVSLNPVVACQLVSYLVDGMMISFLACFVAAMLRYFQRRSLPVLIIAMESAILCINTKFTGLVFLCFFSAAGGIYALIKRRDLLLRYSALQIAAILLGTLVFGYNPYVTNTVNRGHPFYPMMGTAAYPSYSQRGRDPIERYETPRNMLDCNRFYRFGYAIFGRPGSQPFFEGRDSTLMWPFNVSWRDFNIFYFHEVRISGFGPLFSGAFCIALLLLVVAMIAPGIPRLVVVLLCGAIVLSLLVSVHLWWARYGPQLWWLPIVAVIAGLSVPGWRTVRLTAGALAAILLINAVLVATAHFRWEIEATRTTCKQMAELRNLGEIKVRMNFFVEPFGERLRANGVRFSTQRRLQCPNPMELMSVCPGYPGAVTACVHQH